MKQIRLISIFTIAISATYLIPLKLHAQSLCPGHSWLVELHSKRRGINCKSASVEVSQVFDSITMALQSGRAVEISGIGDLLIRHTKKSKLSKESNIRHKKVYFKISPTLTAKINQPVR